MKSRIMFFIAMILLLSWVPSALALQQYVSKGVLEKMNAKTRKVTIKMEAVPSLKWAPMTMSFEVWDKNDLETLKPGQRVEFTFVEKEKGEYLIPKIHQIK